MGSARNPATYGAPTCTADEKRLVLKGVLDSDTFARSDQLRNFLKYVGEMAIDGRSREVTEYLIAVEALGRPSDFSPTGDSSVRSRAHELRRKLEKYYESEDHNPPIRIELPKGCYTPKFVARAAAGTLAVAVPEMVPEVVAPAPPLRDPVKQRSRSAVAALVIGAVLAGAVALQAWMLWRQGPVRRVPSSVLEAWGPLANADSNLLIAVATPLHLIVRPYMAVVAEGLPKYPAPGELSPIYRQHRPLPADQALSMHPVDNSVQMGHMGAVITLAAILNGRGAGFQVLPERSAPVSAMRGRNVILIGDPHDSAAAAEMLAKTPLTIDYDAGLQDLVIRDRRSNSTAYVPKRGPDRRYSEAFGLVTVMPSPGAKADQRVVVLSGISSVGSQGAAEFFASARELEALKKRFESEGLRGFPAAYQVVVRCKSNDTLLVSEEYAAHVVMK